MKLKKPIKILIITVLAAVAAYAAFILLLFYTPLWAYMPENIQMEVIRFKAEREGGFLSKLFLFGSGKKGLVGVARDKNEKPEVRMEAISSIGLKAHYGGKGLNAEEIEALYQVAADKNSHLALRKEALNTLRIEKATDKKIVDLEMEIAGDPDADSDLKFIAVKALGEAGDPRAVDVLMKELENENPDIFNDTITVIALAQIGGEDIIPELLKIALDDGKVPLVRSNAMGVIEYMAVYQGIKNSQAIEALMPLLKHKHYGIRLSAAETLKTLTNKQYEVEEGPQEELDETF